MNTQRPSPASARPQACARPSQGTAARAQASAAPEFAPARQLPAPGETRGSRRRRRYSHHHHRRHCRPGSGNVGTRYTLRASGGFAHARVRRLPGRSASDPSAAATLIRGKEGERHRVARVMGAVAHRLRDGCRRKEKISLTMAAEDTLSSPGLDQVSGEMFLQEAFQIMLEEGIRKGMDASEKVCIWKEPEELQQILDLDLKDSGEPHEKLLERCRDVIRYSVKTCHPRFCNQLFSGLDPHALAGRMITEMLNTSQYTYEIAPVFVLMEEVVLKKLRELIGWEKGDGIFCPGGSISNMYAMNVARYHRFPDCKQKGHWTIPKLAVFTSEECHYSIQKGAAFLGIGTDNVYLVAVDEKGKMIPADLEKQINQAKSERAVPFFVNATCGTTVLGAFDPLPEIAEVCMRHKLWLHVDAAWGGSALLSQRHRHLLDGIERADSVAWNPHKMLMTGLQCSAFLLRDSSGLLQRCHCAQATYLFQTDKFYNIAFDRGDQTIQCGRKVDCFKLWLMWKANGSKGLEQRVDRAFAYTRYLADEIKKREGFQLVIEPEFINLCFWYVPPSLQGQEGCADYWLKLGKVAPLIKEQMMKKGSMMVGYQPHGKRPNFFRQVVTNPAVTREDLDFFLDEIERLGRDL